MFCVKYRQPRQSASNQSKRDGFFANWSGNTHFSVATSGCQAVSDQSLGLRDWALPVNFHSDYQQLQAITCYSVIVSHPCVTGDLFS